jgi:hypothetical protein
VVLDYQLGEMAVQVQDEVDEPVNERHWERSNDLVGR